MAVIIQERRDTAANWTAANPILHEGENAYETDTQKEKRGDGVTAWNALAYKAGGTGTPGGSNTQLQYNASGVLAGFGATDGQALSLTPSNSTLSGNSTLRYGLSVSTNYDSTAVDPAFANQEGIDNVLTSLNGQNQNGGGTNAKQSFFNARHDQLAYAAGQHFNIGNSIYAFGMGDVFTETQSIRTMGGVSASGDEGTGYWSTLFEHYPDVITTAVASVVTPATISTTLTQAVTASRTSQTVTVASSTGVSAGQWVVIDPDDLANIEAVKVTAVAAGSITGVFRSHHNNGVNVRPATVLNIDSGFAFGQGRSVINLSSSSYAVGTASPTASSSTVTGGGTTWTNGMVGGDARRPGYISFTDDDINLSPYGSSATLKSWFPITSVNSTTNISIFRLDVLGSAGYPPNGRAIGGSNYTIRAGARILAFDGATTTIVLEQNAFTWTAGDQITCAHAVDNNWSGILMRFVPLMPGRYDEGILIRNSGEFQITAGLSVDVTGSSASWAMGASLTGAATGLYLNAYQHAINIVNVSSAGDPGSDILWNVDGAAGPSIGANFHFGDNQKNFVISTDGHTYPAYLSGVQSQDGVLSAYKGSPSVLRWNGFLSVGNASPTYSLYVAPTANATVDLTAYFKDATASTGRTGVLIEGGADQASGTFGDLFKIKGGPGHAAIAIEATTAGKVAMFKLTDTVNDWDAGIISGDFYIRDRTNAFATTFKIQAGATNGALLINSSGNAVFGGTVDATGYKAGGTAGVASFGPAAVASITIKNGIVTAIS